MKGAVTCVVLSLFFIFTGCKKEEHKPGTILGTWAITGTLVTTTNPDPAAPQPGFQAMDVWTISYPGNIYTLESSKGTVQGSPVTNGTSEGARFTGMFWVVQNLVWVNFTIDVFVSVDGGIYGTEEFQYFGLNGVGQPMFLGTESWTIDGSAQ